jgi:mannosyltransferase
VSSPSRRSINRWTVILVVLVVTLGAFLRLYRLTSQSLWNDELSSYVRSHFDTVGTVIDDGARYDGHPPGYLILLFGVQKLFGHSEMALRLPSTVAGILSLWLIFLLGRKLYSWREGVLAAGLMAVSWAPVYYSQEARPYAFLILLSLLTTYLWLPFLTLPGGRAKVSAWQTVAYILAALAAAYCHYFGLLLVMLQGGAALVFALHRRRRIARVLVAYALILIGYLPWLAFVRTQIGGQFAAPLPRPSVSIFLEFFMHVFSGPRYVVALVLALYGLALGYVIFRAARDIRPWREVLADSWAGVLLAAWLIVPIVVAFVESWVLLPIVQSRYLLICLPPAYLLLARAITVLPLPRYGRWALAAGMIAVCLFVLVGPLRYYSQPHKQQFRQAVAYVVDHDAAYPDSLVIGSVLHWDYLNYYFEQMRSPRRTDLLASRAEDLSNLVEELEARQPRFVWLVAAHLTPAPQLLDYLDSHLKLVDRQPFLGATVWLYQNRK